MELNKEQIEKILNNTHDTLQMINRRIAHSDVFKTILVLVITYRDNVLGLDGNGHYDLNSDTEHIWSVNVIMFNKIPEMEIGEIRKVSKIQVINYEYK